MFTTAFDASHDDQTFMVVAGLIAPADAWVEFDSAWRWRLKDEGLSYFHMVDFAHSRKAFKDGWKDNETRRQRLLADLMEIIRKYASRKFGWVVENGLFAKHSPQGGWSQYSLDSYSFASMSCVADIMRWCIRDGSPRFESVRFVFEKGDGDGQKDLKKRFHGLGMEVNLELKKDKQTDSNTIEPGFTPLQAADFLAYEVLKVCKELGAGNLTDDKIRWGLKEFQRMAGEVKIATPNVIIKSSKHHEDLNAPRE